ncbi:MAG: aminotransferase class V-fold PLP-dependent enzyme, partial [archaeon]|nr:aminotransferase class V-fold PLP-dependent enzyme [archaeon]
MDTNKIRRDFPILKTAIGGKKLAYLDNAATTQKPRQVIDAITRHYEFGNANVHRGINFLSQKATNAYEEAHEKTAKFVNAQGMEEIIFTKNATESLNLLAYSLGGEIAKGDEILLTELEHHANIVPWQELAKRKKATLKFAAVTPSGELDMSDLQSKTTRRTKIIATTSASNILGTLTPVKKIGEIARDAGALFVVDAAQSAPHTKT